MAYSYLTAEFPEGAKQPSWAPDVRSYWQDSFRRSDFVETAGGDLHYFYAISTQNHAFLEFCRLASQVLAFCRVRGVPRESSFRATLFSGRATWDPGAVKDALDDAAYDVHRRIRPGWVAMHETLVGDFAKADPRLAPADQTRIGSVTNVEGQMTAFDVWSMVEREPASDALLLNAPAATRLIVSVDPGLTTLILALAKTGYRLADLTSRRVEELVAELVHDQGYEVELTAKTKDGGRDIIALRSKVTELVSEQKYLIEVKHPRPGNPVRVEAVRALVGVGHVDPSTGLVLATTSRFTADARAFAHDSTLRYRMSLRDYSDLFSWIREYATKRHRDA